MSIMVDYIVKAKDKLLWVHFCKILFAYQNEICLLWQFLNGFGEIYI